MSMVQTMREGYNYGLFVPPSGGRAGKFLIDDRSIREYNIAHGSLLVVSALNIRTRFPIGPHKTVA